MRSGRGFPLLRGLTPFAHVGDLGHINEDFAQVPAALGDRTGVDELGLKY